MNNISFFPILSGDSRLSQVENLFKELHDSEASYGVTIQLIKNGEKIWMRSIEKMLGKVVQVIVAADGDTIAGICYGSIKMMPAHYGNIIVGYLEGIIVKEIYRGSGIGKGLPDLLIKWFIEKRASIIEVERLVINENFARIMDLYGFKKELLKYRRPALLNI